MSERAPAAFCQAPADGPHARGRPARRLPGQRRRLRRGASAPTAPRAPSPAPALEAVLRADPAELPGLVSRSLKRAGVRFSSMEGDLEFYVDPVPRVITAADWEPVKRGLAQRVRALNAFVADVYGEQRIVAEGVVPPEVISSADYYEPAMRGVKPPSGIWIGVAGLDLVRDHDGEWLVLEDNVRTPSGFAYLHATRRALLEHIVDRPRRAAAAAGRRDRPARRRPARGRARERARPPRAPGRGAHRRRAQLGLLGARLALAPARHPARRARRARASRRPPLAALAWPARAAPDRRPLPPHQRRPPGLRHRPPADRARPERRARARQPVRHRRRRRQAHPRLRRGHDPLLRRRGAGAALRPDLRPRAARAARRGARRLRRARPEAPCRPRRRRRPDRPALRRARRSTPPARP